MSLSLLTSFEDYMLDIASLFYVNEVYRGYYPNEIDPFLNPVWTNEFILKSYPKTVFFLGGGDPLRDSTIKFISEIFMIQY